MYGTGGLHHTDPCLLVLRLQTQTAWDQICIKKWAVLNYTGFILGDS